jgi:nucleoside triphosphate pyrophosphatase
MSPPALILASGSPRRTALLSAAGIGFEVVESGVTEIRLERESATAFALRMAREKALSVSRGLPQAVVLGADTVVECGAEILGKPSGADEARQMLARLSGNVHTVVTAFAIAHAGMAVDTGAVVSRVTFRRLTVHEIETYVATGEPFDKAGAYGIQGASANFIAHVEGSRDNVMGLPVREVLERLERHGIQPSLRGG